MDERYFVSVFSKGPVSGFMKKGKVVTLLVSAQPLLHCHPEHRAPPPKSLTSSLFRIRCDVWIKCNAKDPGAAGMNAFERRCAIKLLF